MMDFINFHLMPGIILGSIYALGAIGISLTFGILRFANFAHGEAMTLGAYFAFTLVQLTGWHPLAVLPLVMILTAADPPRVATFDRKLQLSTQGLLNSISIPPPSTALPPVIVKPCRMVPGPSRLTHETTVVFSPDPSMVVTSGPSELYTLMALPRKSIASL